MNESPGKSWNTYMEMRDDLIYTTYKGHVKANKISSNRRGGASGNKLKMTLGLPWYVNSKFLSVPIKTRTPIFERNMRFDTKINQSINLDNNLFLIRNSNNTQISPFDIPLSPTPMI